VKNCFTLLFFSVTLFLQGLSVADTVTFKDGLRGKGIIVKVTPDTLYFLKSGSTHVVAIPRGPVKQFEKDTSFIDSSPSDATLSDSMKTPQEETTAFFPCRKLELNNGAEILPSRFRVGLDSCDAFALVYKGCNFEIGETPTLSILRNTDFRENPYPHGTGFRAGGFVSAAWGTFFTILGCLLNGSNVREAKGIEYTGLALLGNSAVLFGIGYTRKSKYNRWEERHPFKQPITIDKEE
jgi:hypothetical protein